MAFNEEQANLFTSEVLKLKKNLDNLDAEGLKKYESALKKQKNKCLELLEKVLNDEVFLPYVVMAHACVSDECAKYAEEVVSSAMSEWIDLTINNPNPTLLFTKMDEVREKLYSFKAKLELAHWQEIAKDPLNRYKIA